MPPTASDKAGEKPAKATTPPGHLAALDAMRGVAALAVVAFHAHAMLAPFDIGHAYLAVDLFFGLSGLVIARAYSARLDAGLRAGTFLRLRFVRLYPLYALGVLAGAAEVVLALALTGHDANPSLAPRRLIVALVSAAMMVPSPLAIDPIGRLAPFNVAAWSLFFEMAANIMLALLWRWLTPARLWLVIAVSGMILAAGIVLHGSADVGADWSSAGLAIARTAFSFFLGVAIERHVPARPHRAGPVWPLLGGLVLLLALPRALVWPWYDIACIGLAFPALIVAGATMVPRARRLSQALGDLSYPIYALHTPLLVLAGVVLRRLHAAPAAPAPLAGIVALAATAGVAMAVARMCDLPLRNRLGALLGVRKQGIDPPRKRRSDRATRSPDRRRNHLSRP